MTLRLLSSLRDNWGMFFGDLTLKGIDPRLWDLPQLLTAYETMLRQSAKDEADWRKTRSKLYADPDAGRRRRSGGTVRPQAAAGRQGISAAALSGLLASAAKDGQ